MATAGSNCARIPFGSAVHKLREVWQDDLSDEAPLTAYPLNLCRGWVQRTESTHIQVATAAALEDVLISGMQQAFAHCNVKLCARGDRRADCTVGAGHDPGKTVMQRKERERAGGTEEVLLLLTGITKLVQAAWSWIAAAPIYIKCCGSIMLSSSGDDRVLYGLKEG
eukprot:1320781-Amphidinium_carterae.1